MSWHEKIPYPNSLSSYGDIKKKCERWGIKKGGALNERSTLSVLYEKFSPYTNCNSDMILLDVEIGFPCLYLNGKDIKDNVQVDLLFLDLHTNMLYFVEAKEAADGRIKTIPEANESLAELYKRLEVSHQIEKYRANLKQRGQQIIEAYSNYLDIMRQIFDCNFPAGELKLYPNPKLFVYGQSTAKGEQCIKAICNELANDLILNDKVECLSKEDIIKNK